MKGPFGIILLCVCLFSLSEVEGTSDRGSNSMWLTNILPTVLLKFTTTSEVNQKCNEDINLYKTHLANSTLWAVKMYDASVVKPTGIVTSSSYNFGALDQCITIDVPEFEINGKYCIPQLSFRPNITTSPEFYETTNSSVFIQPGPFQSAWLQFKRSKDKRIKYRDTIGWAMCIPSSCSSEDLAVSLNKELTPILLENGIRSHIYVNEDNCQTLRESPNPNYITYAYILFCSTLATSVVLVTLLHMYAYTDEERQKLSHWIFKLSIITNLKKLGKPEGSKELQLLSGMKVWSMVIIIYGHRHLTALYENILNPGDHEKRYGQFFETINFNGAIVVNTFFLIGGFLSFYKCITEIKNKRQINIPLYILYRWMRITPVYLAVIGFTALILPLSISGPFWKGEGLLRFNNCKRNWWIHILYINNYYKTEEECLIPGWYLAVDMQLYIICIITGFIMYKRKNVIPFVLGFLTFFSIAIPAYVIYNGGYDAIIKFYLNYLPSYFSSDDYVNTYTKTHMRATPYFIGMISALIYSKMVEAKFKFKKWQIIVGIILAILFIFGTLLAAWVFFIPDFEDNPTLNGLYGSLSKLTWPVGLSWIILAEATTGFGILAYILKHNLYVPLSKLTLCVLLVHTPVIQYITINQRRPNHLYVFYTIWMSCGDVMISYFLALVLYLIVEAPLANIQVSLLKKLLKPKSKLNH